MSAEPNNHMCNRSHGTAFAASYCNLEIFPIKNIYIKYFLHMYT